MPLLVTLSRDGGEGADLSYGEVNYLALDENEKAMLQNVAEMKKNGTVKKTILLINSANACRSISSRTTSTTSTPHCGSVTWASPASMPWPRS